LAERYSDYSNKSSGNNSASPRKRTNASSSAGETSQKKAKNPGKNKMSADKRAEAELTAEEKKLLAKKRAFRNKILKIAAIIVAVSAVLSIICISCLNDILAINRSNEEVTVTITEDSDGNINTKNVIIFKNNL